LLLQLQTSATANLVALAAALLHARPRHGREPPTIETGPGAANADASSAFSGKLENIC
jgi:hypothetical protein